MVAGTGDHHPAPYRHSCDSRKQLFCKFLRLYPVLMREKQLETALAFVLILLIVVWATGWYFLLPWIILAGFILGAIPWVLRRFYKGWSFLLNIIHRIVSTILLSLIFFLVVTPLSFFVRRSRKRTLILNNLGRKTLFVDRHHTYKPEDFVDPW